MLTAKDILKASPQFASDEPRSRETQEAIVAKHKELFRECMAALSKIKYVALHGSTPKTLAGMCEREITELTQLSRTGRRISQGLEVPR